MNDQDAIKQAQEHFPGFAWRAASAILDGDTWVVLDDGCDYIALIGEHSADLFTRTYLTDPQRSKGAFG